jgi:hypothetical protein
VDSDSKKKVRSTNPLTNIAHSSTDAAVLFAAFQKSKREKREKSLNKKSKRSTTADAYVVDGIHFVDQLGVCCVAAH